MHRPAYIGDILHRIKRPIEIDPLSKYKLVTVRLYHNGVVLREEKLGSNIKSKMYQVKAGDFILSGIDARNGAFGIVPPELDGAVVTNDFWYFDIDDELVDKNFFLELTATHWFDEICRKGSDGTTQRIRLQKGKFFNQIIYLPDLSAQRRFSKRFRTIKSSKLRLVSELSKQKNLLEKLRQQILRESIEGKLSADWRNKNPDIESANALLKRISVVQGEWIEENAKQDYKEAKVLQKKISNLKITATCSESLPKSWVICPLIRLANLIVDCHNKTAPYEDHGVKLVRTTNVRNRELNLVTTKFVSEATYKFWSKRAIPRRGDILFTREAPVGEAAIIPTDEKICMGQRMMLIRVFKNLVNRKYLLFAITEPNFLKRLEKNHKGAMVKHLRVGDVENAMVAFPPLDEQNFIVEKVEKLLALCDQLEAQITENQSFAEQLMRAVLDEAFSDQSAADRSLAPKTAVQA